jgi:glutamyl-Q tRNA(Asp) synthetase
VTHSVRGTDLEAATDIHRVLQVLLDLPSPLYWHHPLILGSDGRKLAKSKGSESLAFERDQGLTLADVIASFKRAGFADLLSYAEQSQPERA